MISETQDELTEAVLAEMHRTPEARTKEILSALVRHLHQFVKEVKLTEREFQEAIGLINAIGQKTTPSHNEAMLVAGALGVSNLVCLINNAHPTQANNLGPFFRAGAPHCHRTRAVDCHPGRQAMAAREAAHRRPAVRRPRACSSRRP